MPPGIPSLGSIDGLARFWDSHDITEFEADLEEVADVVFRRQSSTASPT